MGKPPGIGTVGVGRTGTLLRCVECGTESDALAMGWRAYVAPDPQEEPEGEIFLFCLSVRSVSSARWGGRTLLADRFLYVFRGITPQSRLLTQGTYDGPGPGGQPARFFYWPCS